MAILSVLLEAIARLAAISLGCWLAYTEATGTAEFYLAQEGDEWTYIVKAAVGTALASVILPYFLHRSIKKRQWVVALGTLVGFILSVAVIFNAAVHRTGSPVDQAEADRRLAKRQLDAAKANVKDIEGAGATDRMLLGGECRTGVGKECRRLAREGKDTLQATIELRKELAGVKELPEDGTAKRLSLLTGGIVSEEQMRLFQPMLLPVSVSFLAGLLITVGLDMDHPGAPKPERKGWRWRWRRNEPDASGPATHSENVSPKSEVIDMAPKPQPVPAVPPRVPVRPRPRLASTTRQPVGSALDFLHEAVEIVEGPTRVEMSDACIGYGAWCKARSLRPVSPGEFFNDMTDLCAQFGIPIQEEAGHVYLVNVLITSPAMATQEEGA